MLNSCKFKITFSNPWMNAVSPALMRLVWSSSAVWAIAPLQDWLNLDASCRFNIPGTVEKLAVALPPESLESLDLTSLRHWTQIYGRAPG